MMTSAPFAKSTQRRFHATYTESFFAAALMFFREFATAAFSPYHPEKHYMRGPGPAWHAKHGPSANS
jgi:hypothetical protein